MSRWSLVGRDPGQADLQEALELARDFPRNPASASPVYKAILSQAAGNAGEGLFRSGRTVRAAALLRESEAVVKEIETAAGQDPALFAHRGRVLSVLGRLEGERGDPTSGLRSCEHAREEQEQALREAPWDKSLQRLAGYAGGRRPIAIPGRAIGRGRLGRRAAAGPGRANGPGATGACVAVLPGEGGCVGGGARWAVAGKGGRGRGGRRGGGSAASSRTPGAGRPARCSAHGEGKRTAQGRGRSDEQALLVNPPDLPGRFWDRQPLREPEDYELRRVWAELLARKGEALARKGQFEAAAECVSKAITTTEELVQGDRDILCPPNSWPAVWQVLALKAYRREPCYLYDLACCLALASTLPGQALSRIPPAGRCRPCADLVASGFDNPHKLQTDPRLAPLRERRFSEARPRAASPGRRAVTSSAMKGYKRCATDEPPLPCSSCWW